MTNIYINNFLNNINSDFETYYNNNFTSNEVDIIWEAKNFDFQNIPTKNFNAIILIRNDIEASGRSSLGDTYNRRVIIKNLLMLYSKQTLGNSYHLLLNSKLVDFFNTHKSSVGYQSADTVLIGPTLMPGSESHINTTVSQDYTINIPTKLN